MYARIFAVFVASAAFALQGCQDVCGKMEEASAHIHEAGKPCTGLEFDYEPMNSLESAACWLVVANTEGHYCDEKMVLAAECKLEIAECDPNNPDAFYKAQTECDKILDGCSVN